jgi:glyoxylase-like metal-dependent hydrolase (beta-lactamase superfamily II)
MKRFELFALLFLIVTAPIAAHAQFPEPDGGNLEHGVLPRQWQPAGPHCMEIPDWQVHEYNPTFFILRQSGCTDYEKPFLYLIFGQDKALLFDTGSRNGNLVPTLQRTIHNWLERNHRQSIPLIVTHSHSHEDHTWGDPAVQAMNDPAIPVTFVPATVAYEKSFYQITDGPDGKGTDAHGLVDLGSRAIDVIPIPGHDSASIALYDRRTGILLTGDSLYPGRLYIHSVTEFQTSTERLIRFTEGKPIAHILGCHIEETRTPFLDYAIGSIYQPDEHSLELSVGALLELEDGLKSLNGVSKHLALRDFSLWPVAARNSSMSPHTQKTFEQVQAEQLKNKWDQPK